MYEVEKIRRPTLKSRKKDNKMIVIYKIILYLQHAYSAYKNRHIRI